MTLQNRDREHANMAISEKVIHVDADYEMKLADKCIRTVAALTLTLPPVTEAAGNIYAIAVEVAGAVTVQDRDESAYWPGDYSLAAEGDTLVLYSDGLAWHEIASVIAP